MEWNKHTANSSFKDVVKFIDYFYNQLAETIKQKYNLINLDLPLVSNMKSDVNLLNNNRAINFDNYNDKNIYEIIYEPDNMIRYYCWFLELTNNDVVVSKYKQINRDAIINNSSSIENNMLNFEFFILEEQKKEEYVLDLINYFWNIFLKIVYSSSLNKNYRLETKKIRCVSLKEIKKMYLVLPIKDAVDKFILNNGIHLIKDISNKFEHDSNVYLEKSSDSHDFENTYSLLFFDENSQQVKELITITFRPNWDTYKKQKGINGEKILNNNFTDILKKDSEVNTCSFKINFDLLIYYFLSKTDIQEIPSCNSDFNLDKIYKLYFNK
ncbi:hypothetical protein [Malacoplasma iowae]|uniref:Uncharacterized protein n=1 Tax=Malacoplasma iowae 695 TaxID=1048830 RepID=A0A6P1LAY9_MALIO|nr:hypothetical protein [Malacoplasma iowae]VEU63225.1 Uncharacterised protein [Mycoplasmopsis fermentans]EGZ31196.1 hypothetical protein GUU_03028 [Malacoplasma iowae 695]QHG89586.1 hypothetical protein EER00_01565 [Malacoplasma iowae 695]WPL35635.1 hypothetical protein QX180_04900 [Malacoplasma iowae]WPL38983.1 hypothetical protein QX181_00395 [Malacoplasma iowae]